MRTTLHTGARSDSGVLTTPNPSRYDGLMPSEKIYYLWHHDQQYGPFTASQVRAQRGSLASDTLYCTDTMPQWRPITELIGRGTASQSRFQWQWIAGILSLFLFMGGIALWLSHENELRSYRPSAAVSTPTPAPNPAQPPVGVSDSRVNAPAASPDNGYSKVITGAQSMAVNSAQSLKEAQARAFAQGLKEGQAKALAAANRAKVTQEKALAYTQRFKESQAKTLAEEAAKALKEAKLARYQKASSALMNASREDQLIAAEIQKMYEKNGPFTSEQFQFLDEKTKWATATYVPWALPVEMLDPAIDASKVR